MYNETPRWFAKSQRLNQNVNEGRKRLQRVPVTSPTSWRLNFFVETESELLVEQIVDVPLPHIVEEIVEAVQIVKSPVPQIELVFFFVVLVVFCAVAWSVARVSGIHFT